MDRPKWINEESAAILDSEAIIFNINLENGTKITINMLNDLDIIYEEIENQLEDIPSIFAFYGAIYSELKMNVAIAERKIKAKRGRLYQAIIDQAKADNTKLTEKVIERLVEKDDNINKLEFQYMILQKNVGKLWYKIEALKMKCDNLRSLAGFKKQEQSR